MDINIQGIFVGDIRMYYITKTQRGSISKWMEYMSNNGWSDNPVQTKLYTKEDVIEKYKELLI